MDGLIQFGINFIIRFQALGDWLVAPMEFFSFLGSENVFLFVLPLLFWCVDAGLGIRIGIILLTSQVVNDVFKMAFHQPRPYWVSERVTGYASETGFGVPSGHSHKPLAIFGMIAAHYKRTWVWILVLTVVFLIGLSRMFLGVHFPHDLLLGWFIGGVMLWAFIKYWNPVAARLKQMSLGGQAATAFLVSLVFIALNALVVFLSRDFILPAEWIANATRAGGEAPNPFSIEGSVSAMGTLFGFCAGLAWINTRGGYQVSGPLTKRVLRYIVGFLGVAILYFGLKMVFPDGEDVMALVFRYIRYTLVGAWISAGAPWTFSKLQIS
ncbi:MAG: hypothetical protein HFACDABA_02145 [Anaerolineales bacterium]|nr:hypothetical protein [Anaerolineales bacterium]